MKLLNFLNLLDAQGNLSITNAAVLTVLIKLTLAPTASITEAGMLLIALANYAHKRFVSNQNNTEDNSEVTELTKKVEEMSTQVSAMSIQNGIKKLS